MQYPHNDLMVISLKIANNDVNCILVDNGSSMDVLFYDVFLKMGISTLFKEAYGPLSGLSGDLIPVEEIVTLPMIAGQAPRRSLVRLAFTIVKASSAYNAIVGRPDHNTFCTIILTCYLFMRFPTILGSEKSERTKL